MYKVLLFHKAQKTYQKLPQDLKVRVNQAIDLLQENPFSGSNIKPLIGSLQGNYRLRIGDYRIVYTVDESKDLVIVKAIGPRGSIYK